MRGSWMLDRVTPDKLLTGFAAVAGGLVLVSLSTTGALAGWSLIAVGPFNSIMFPTLFSLASEGQGSKTPQGAGPAVHGRSPMQPPSRPRC